MFVTLSDKINQMSNMENTNVTFHSGQNTEPQSGNSPSTSENTKILKQTITAQLDPYSTTEELIASGSTDVSTSTPTSKIRSKTPHHLRKEPTKLIHASETMNEINRRKRDSKRSEDEWCEETSPAPFWDTIKNDKGEASLFNRDDKGKAIKQRSNKQHLGANLEDEFNKNAEKFSKDPWARPTPTAFDKHRKVLDEVNRPSLQSKNLLPDNFGDTTVKALARNRKQISKEIKKSKSQSEEQPKRKQKKIQQQENRIRSKRGKFIKEQVDKFNQGDDHTSPLPHSDIMARDNLSNGSFSTSSSGSGGSSSSSSSSSSSTPEDDESGEQGLNFALPDRIVVESYPFYDNVISAFTMLKSAKSILDTTWNSITMMFNASTTQNVQWILLYSAARIIWTLYCMFQTHYVKPHVLVVLQRCNITIDQVKRHAKNQISDQTPTTFVEYEYSPKLILPTKHWMISLGMWTLNKIFYYGDMAIKAAFPSANWAPLPIISLPDEIDLPSFLRVEDMTKFYNEDHGTLVPKREKVNVDLMDRALTTKALNHHLPLEQQMRTITAIINNQIDTNRSSTELIQSTVSSTLTVLKFHILNQTEDVAALGFDQASTNLIQNMATGTIRLTHGGGRHSLRSRKTPLPYDPLQTLTSGFIGVCLFSVTLVLPVLASRYLIPTLQIQFRQFLEKSRDLGVEFPSLSSVPDSFPKDPSTIFQQAITTADYLDLVREEFKSGRITLTEAARKCDAITVEMAPYYQISTAMEAYPKIFHGFIKLMYTCRPLQYIVELIFVRSFTAVFLLLTEPSDVWWALTAPFNVMRPGGMTNEDIDRLTRLAKGLHKELQGYDIDSSGRCIGN